MHAELWFLSSFAIQISSKGILYDFVRHEQVAANFLFILSVIILCYMLIITEIHIVFYAMSNFRMMFKPHYAIESNCMKRWIIIQSKWFPSPSTKLAAIGDGGNNLKVCRAANSSMVKIAHFYLSLFDGWFIVVSSIWMPDYCFHIKKCDIRFKISTQNDWIHTIYAYYERIQINFDSLNCLLSRISFERVNEKSGSLRLNRQTKSKWKY